MRKSFILSLLFCMGSFFALHAQETNTQAEKPRIIILTDAEVDDRSSMIHLLLCSNEVDIEGIIQAASFSHPNGHSKEPWLANMMDHYAQVYPNLKVHAVGYPTPEKLKSVCLVGDENPKHIVVKGNGMNRYPGDSCQIDPTSWEETPGSKKIVETLLDQDPRKVYLLCWGGGNTAAKAFQILKDKHSKADYERACKKAVMYNIWYQDGAGNYIETHHPDVTMVLSYYFLDTWAYGALRYSEDFVKYHFDKKNPLVADYPNDYINEGDSPSFYYVLGNGLRGYADPTWGGWGGQFYKVEGFRNVYRDIDKVSYRCWTENILRDFEVRAIWCNTPNYEDANHYPVIHVEGALDRTAHAGEIVDIKYSVIDNDKPNPEAMWKRFGTLWQQQGMSHEQYLERSKNMHPMPPIASCSQWLNAGTCKQWVKLNTSREGVSFTVPKVEKPETIHLLIEATDQGEPALTSYQRVVVTILP